MARILIVDDEEPTVRVLREMLKGPGHEIVTFSEAAVALEYMRSADLLPELIISDINMPGMNGFDFRDRIRDHVQLQKIPFIFLTAADDTISRQVARRLMDEVVVLKPPSVPTLRRLVSSMLGQIQREEGELDNRALSDLFQRAEKEALHGIITLFVGEKIKKIFIRNGKLAFAIGNDPTEWVGQAMIREGWVSEEGLTSLFAARGGQSVPLGEVFLNKVAATRDQLNELLERKMREAVLDLFIADGGRYEVYFDNVPTTEIPFDAKIRLEGIVEEGLRRALAWRKVRSVLPDTETSFEVNVNGIPDGELDSDGDRILAQLLGEGRSLGQIQLELRGQRYLVGTRIAEWLRLGYITPAAGYTFRRPTPSRIFREPVNVKVTEAEAESFDGNTPPVTPPPLATPHAEVQQAMERALTHHEQRELEQARSAFQRVLELDPSNPLARSRLDDINAELSRDAQSAGLSGGRQLVLEDGGAVDVELNSDEEFVFSRLAAQPMTVEALIQVSPLSESEVFRILMKFVSAGWVKVV